MSGNERAGGRILGSLGSADGKGAVRMQDRFDTDIGDVWSALTDPSRLARWYGEVEGDLRAGGEFRVRVLASGWEGTGRVEACEPPRRLVVTGKEPDQPGGDVSEVTLAADGDQTILVLDQPGLPLEDVSIFLTDKKDAQLSSVSRCATVVRQLICGTWSECGYLLKAFAWRAVRKVDPIRNQALCKRQLDALRTEVARGNANEGAPDERQ